LHQQPESRAKFLKLILDRVSKFGWMKQLVTILIFEIQSSAFVFFESLNLSPLNSRSLENY